MFSPPPYVHAHTDDVQAGVLERGSCLSALSELRHTKWFQVGLAGWLAFGQQGELRHYLCILLIVFDMM